MEIKCGEYQGLTYTIAQPKSNFVNVPKPIHARAKAVVWIFKWFNKFSLKSATKVKVNPLYPRINEGVAQGNVVLVVLQFMDWDRKDGAGNLNQMLHYAYIGAIAKSRHQAFRIHKNQHSKPMIKPAPPEFWIHSKQLFLWFEDEEKRKEQSNYDQGNLYWETVA